MSLLYSANSVLGYDLMADSGPAVAKHACLLKEAINHKHCVKSSFLAYKLHLMWITLWSYYFIYTTPSSVLKFWMPVTYSKHVCGVPSTLQCEAVASKHVTNYRCSRKMSMHQDITTLDKPPIMFGSLFSSSERRDYQILIRLGQIFCLLKT